VAAVHEKTKEGSENQTQDQTFNKPAAMTASVQAHSGPVGGAAFSAALGLEFLDGLVPEFFLRDDAFFFLMREFHVDPLEISLACR
jgi:hypothetical protein